MATQKPISTISYNTEPFLSEVLQELYEEHIIQAYQYICHKGEDGDKDHIHLRIEPNKKIDQMDLSERFREYSKDNRVFDKNGNEIPLTIRPWRPSKEEDWFLYVVHDAEYIKFKYSGGDKSEKLPYQWEEIKASPFYDVETAFVRAKQSMKYTNANLVKRLQSGESVVNIVSENGNPFITNAILKSLALTDYERVAREYADLRCKHDALLRAVENFGLMISTDSDGNIELISEK